MQAFVSTSTMKVDKKGRVSVPAPFRAILAADGFSGVYCIPTPDGEAIDAGGNRLVGMLEDRLNQLEPTSLEYDLLATAFYGESHLLGIDADGRIALPERLKDQAGIGEQVLFVGKGLRFQLWQPERYETYRQEALRLAREVRWGSGSLTAGAGLSRRVISTDEAGE